MSVPKSTVRGCTTTSAEVPDGAAVAAAAAVPFALPVPLPPRPALEVPGPAVARGRAVARQLLAVAFAGCAPARNAANPAARSLLRATASAAARAALRSPQVVSHPWMRPM